MLFQWLRLRNSACLLSGSLMQSKQLVFAVVAFVGLALITYRFVGGSAPVPILPFTEDRPDALAAVQPERPVVKEVAASAPIPMADTESAPEQTRARAGGPPEWAVIAATYNNFGAAAKRASSLRSQFADCACSVYPREGSGQRYYVIVASGVAQDAAERHREQALAAGLPSDTYVTKLVISE